MDATRLTEAQDDLKGKVAVITGAARGLGLTFAKALARAGCNVAALDIQPGPSPAIQTLQKDARPKVEYYQTDVSSASNIESTISKILHDFAKIDININAAGIAHDQPFLTTSPDIIQRTLAVNFTGSFLVAQACANVMVKQYQAQWGDKPATKASNGTIIFIASIATYMASSAQSISCYTASKAAVRGMVKPIAMELSRFGIRVNSLSPGYTMTDMMRELQVEQPGLVRQFEAETLFGRIGEAEELEGAMLWLCSEKASGWYTGQDLLVDGGATSWKHPAGFAQIS